GWPVSASTLAAASNALRRWFSACAGGAASACVALEVLAVFLVARVLAGFFFFLGLTRLLENAGFIGQHRSHPGGGKLAELPPAGAASKAILGGILDFSWRPPQGGH